MTILPKGTEAAFHHKIPKTTEEWGGTEGLAEVTDGRLLVTLGLHLCCCQSRNFC